MNILITNNLENGCWSNGLNQNCFFLADLLTNLGHNVGFLVSHSLEGTKENSDYPVFHITDLDHLTNIDYFLQASFVCPDRWIDILKSKNPRCRNIHIHYGNRMIGDIEDCKLNTVACSPYLVNEVWISPHFSFSKEYYETFYKTKVRVIKYIWDHKFVDKLQEKCKKIGETLYHNPNKDFDFCITDSNLTFLKNCIPSISIFENYIYKNETDKKLHVFCTDSLVKSKHFSSWAQSLLSFQEEKLIFHGRENYDLIFGPNNYGLISHQILCGLNYSYLEALYFGVPILHNSNYFKKFGYYYKNYNTNQGGNQLKDMVDNYNQNFDSFIENNKKAIFKYSPHNPEVVKQYKEIIK